MFCFYFKYCKDSKTDDAWQVLNTERQKKPIKYELDLDNSDEKLISHSFNQNQIEYELERKKKLVLLSCSLQYEELSKLKNPTLNPKSK